MNQGKLEVVKQEMARVNVDILGNSELKWTGMVNVTQMTIISTTAFWTLLLTIMATPFLQRDSCPQ